jgi:zinc protease
MRRGRRPPLAMLAALGLPAVLAAQPPQATSSAPTAQPAAPASQPAPPPPPPPTARAPVETVGQLRYPPPPPFELPQPRRVTLDNGMVVMLLEDHELPLVTVTALLRTGSRLDPPAKLGLAALGGELMRSGGIARRAELPPAKGGALSGDALDDLLESHAAVLEVAVGAASGSATLNCLREDFAGLLPLFAAVLREPAFDPVKLDLARDLAKARLERENDDPQAVLWREFGRLVYGPDSVYGRTPTFATLDAIEVGDLVAWHRRNLRPERVVLGLVGDFDTAAALAAVRAAFGDWQRGAAEPEQAAGGPLAAPAYRRQPNPGLFVVDKSDITQSEVVMGHLGVVKNDPDFLALEVLDEVLAGSFASRLVAHVRTEKGLAYAVDGRVGSDWDHPGLAALYLSTKARTTAAGVEALLAEARDLIARPPTDEEVTRAKQSILASFVFHADSREKVLDQLLTFELFGYPADWLARYRAGIEATTTAAVRQAAARHLHPEQFTILVVGPGETADRSLAAFGKPIPLPLPDVTGGARAPQAPRRWPSPPTLLPSRQRKGPATNGR